MPSNLETLSKAKRTMWGRVSDSSRPREARQCRASTRTGRCNERDPSTALRMTDPV
jgi:hypothetical protein